MQTLQDILRARLAADPRCHVGAIVEKNGQTHITFGAFGDVDRVDLIVQTNEILVGYPEVAGVPIPAPDATIHPAEYTFPIDPSDFNKIDLLKIAAARRVDVDPDDVKAKIAEAINRDAGFASE